MGGGDLRGRVVVAVPLAAAAILLVSVGGWLFAAGVSVIGLLCLHEYFGLVETRRPVRLAGFIGLLGLAVAARVGEAPLVLAVAWASLPLIFLLVAVRPGLEGATDSTVSTGLGIWWIGVAIAYAIMLRDLPHGGGIVLDVLIGTFAMDTGAYFGGRALGTRPLAPRISPRKTVEGLLTGFVAAVVAVFVAGLYQDWLGGWEAIAIGAVAGVLAPLGDLFESLLKRDAGAKDAANLLGPHGGFLDRIDGVLFSVVGVYWLWSLIA